MSISLPASILKLRLQKVDACMEQEETNKTKCITMTVNMNDSG